MNYSRTVTTEYGLVRGIVKDGCEEYLGIPFAKPPVGDLAFKHPVPPEPWEGFLDAVRGPVSPVQGKGRSTIEVDSKDCLYLNVFVPEGIENNAPVMVWFYGGSYANGGCGRVSDDSDELVYDLAKFARETKTVVVSFNYRLNLEGFLNLNFLDKNFDKSNGLYDQMAALKFVRNNINRFRGDADNVTVFGQSAGAACIIALLGMPEAKLLFDKAILQSPCVVSFWTEQQSERLTYKYLKYIGIKPEELGKLKDMDIESIHAANRELRELVFREGNSNCAFSPVIDGTVIKGRPADLAKQSNKPILIGTCSQEGDAFICNIPTVALPLAAYWFKFKFVPGKNSRRRMSDDFTKTFYTDPSREIAREIKGPSWVYEYQYMTPDIEKRGAGCYHASELPVLFGKSTPYANVDDPISRCVGEKMRDLWSEFAHTGKLPWKQFKDGEEIKPLK
ncbi:carboxylesterase/lipase family protein [Butyrivibrio sp. AE2032]|uniref:carboxylesterase/lipase family protein n=1 Tax=Butyrivibrio sp. AE2032 TaxID=1458463 RepID=UPI000690B3CE|nr:carboxylesterase family protein [Butyrivibrio sp. AE2032]